MEMIIAMAAGFLDDVQGECEGGMRWRGGGGVVGGRGEK